MKFQDELQNLVELLRIIFLGLLDTLEKPTHDLFKILRNSFIDQNLLVSIEFIVNFIDEVISTRLVQENLVVFDIVCWSKFSELLSEFGGLTKVHSVIHFVDL